MTPHVTAHVTAEVTAQVTAAWISTEHYLPKIWADRMHSYRLPGVVTPAGTEPVRICAVVGGPFYA